MKSRDILSGKYELTQEIGKGAMGAVWAAQDLVSNRSVAVKFILPQQKEPLTHDLRQRLVREARACGKLRHRNIVQIYDMAETADGEPFLVLELLHGQTLAQLLEHKRRIEPVTAARIVAEAACGLAAAHSAQVIHRDLKPDNMYLHREEGAPDGVFVLKILDFGVCKTTDSVDSIVTQQDTAVGTPAYMSPEQVAMRKDLDHRTDIWSLGIVLYELLTGARPFSGSVADVVRQILLTTVPPPSAKVREVPPELDAVVALCTARKREKRYASAQDVANALLAIAETHRPAQRKMVTGGRMVPPPASIPALSAMSDAVSSAEGNHEPSSVTKPFPNVVPIMPPNSSPVANDAAMAATLPLSKLILTDALQADRREPSSPGTQILHTDQALGSPEPPWKQEMKEALAARRHSASDVDVLRFDESAVGHMQIVTPEVCPSASQLSISIADGVPPPAAETTSGTTMPLPYPTNAPMQRRRRSKVLLGTVGMVVVATLAVGAVLAMNRDKPNEQAKGSGPEASAQAAASLPDVAPVKIDTPSPNVGLPPEVVKPERSKKTESPPPAEKGRSDGNAGPNVSTAPEVGVTGAPNKTKKWNPNDLRTPATKLPDETSKQGRKPCKFIGALQKLCPK